MMLAPALVRTVSLLALAVPAVAVAAPAAAAPLRATAAEADVFVEVNPSTIEAGERVGIRASCTDNTRNAVVRADVFGRVTVHPRGDFLVATADLRDTLLADTYTVRLECPNGDRATASLHVVSRTRPEQGPATGFGG
ncbi:MAG TPA: hypothetical protein VES42_21470, partial [Pilimelia sp.]|nr:hypothetical protein [Pilimelia sp.]